MELDTSYRQKRCRHGWIDGKQCEACATELSLNGAMLEIKRLNKAMLSASKMLERRVRHEAQLCN